MNAATLTRSVARPNAPAPAADRQPARGTSESRCQSWQSEEDRVFEARLKWFLEVSRNA